MPSWIGVVADDDDNDNSDNTDIGNMDAWHRRRQTNEQRNLLNRSVLHRAFRDAFLFALISFKQHLFIEFEHVQRHI